LRHYAASQIAARSTIARWHGEIIDTPRGHAGFGYDPHFLLRAHGCTAAELPAEVKNRISHRGLAMQMLAEKLRHHYR
jgi:XTP/dITP diphosphohydrolase